MGFLGGDNEPSDGEQLIDEQLKQNQAELEAKKQNLYKTRLDIIKGQGQQSWVPDMTPGTPSLGGMNANKGSPADFFDKNKRQAVGKEANPTGAQVARNPILGRR